MSNISYFYLPNTSLFGSGCLDDIGHQANLLHLNRLLLVTDSFLSKTDTAKRIADIILNSGGFITTYEGVKPNPTLESVYEAYNIYRQFKCNGIISLGGGSSHDCAKAVSILATNPAPLEQYVGINKFANRSVPVIAVNTTAGTASEITNCFIITDTETNTKLIFEGVYALTATAINDPEIMVTLPASLTASTGMDALTHAVECYVSNLSFRLTDDLARLAVRYIFQNLALAVKEPENITARENMIYGEYLAGMAFGNGGVGLVHAIAHALGGIYDLPHGLCNAVMLPYIITFNMNICAKKYAELYYTIHPEKSSALSDMEAAHAFCLEVESLSKEIGTCKKLHELKVSKNDFERIAEKALSDSCCDTNPIQPSKADIINLLKYAY